MNFSSETNDRQRPQGQHRLIRKALELKLNDQFQGGSAVWIHGPAGSGKSSLAVDYLRHIEMPYIKYETNFFDTGDDSYFKGFISLIHEKKIAPNFKPSEIGLMDVEAWGRRFFYDLCQHVREPFALVFDNLERLGSDAGAFGFLRSGLEVVPSSCRLFFISRNGPADYFARFYGTEKLSTIDGINLRLTMSETRELAGLANPSFLTGNFAEKLFDKTGGWLVAVDIWLRSANMVNGDETIFDGAIPKFLGAYIESEFFDPLPGDVQDTLMLMGGMPQESGEMVKVLMNIPHFAITWARISSLEPLITRCDGGGFQLSPLLHEFLFNRGSRMLKRETMVLFISRAVGLLLDNGHVEGAGKVFDHGYREEGAGARVAEYLRDKMLTGESSLIRSFIRVLSDSAVLSDPWLQLARSAFDDGLPPAERVRELKRLYVYFSEIKDTGAVMIILNALVEMALHINAPMSRKQLNWLLTEISGLDFHRASPDMAAVEAALLKNIIVFLSVRRPGHRLLAKMDSRAADSVSKQHTTGAELPIARALAWKALFLGDLPLAGHYFEVSNIDVQEDAQIRWRTDTLAWKMFNALVNGRFEDARKAAGEGLKLCEGKDRDRPLPILLHAGIIACDLGAGKLKSAENRLIKLPKKHFGGHSLYGFLYHALEFWRGMLCDELFLIQTHAKAMQRCAMEADAHLLHPVALGAMAYMHHKLGDVNRALDNIGFAVKLSRIYGATHLQYSLLMIGAHIRYSADKRDDALSVLKKGISLGNRRSFLYAWFWRDEIMSVLCRRAIQKNIKTKYVQRLIRARRLQYIGHGPRVKNWPWPISIYIHNRFSLLVDEKPVEFTSRITAPLLMLKALIVMGKDKTISTRALIEAMWADSDQRLAKKKFKVTLHRLRSILHYKDAIRLSNGNLMINSGICWVDCWELEHRISEAETAWGDCRIADQSKDRAANLTSKLLDGISARFMPEVEDQWAIFYRKEMTRRLLNCVIHLAKYYEDLQDWLQAAHVYTKALEIFSDQERVYKRMMYCYHKLGFRSMAISTYRLCTRVSQETNGQGPSTETQNFYRKVLSNAEIPAPRWDLGSHL